MNYAQAQKITATARYWTDGKPLGNNTHLMCRFSHFAIRLHRTDILDIFPNGSYRLRTGGFRTVTTKARLNQYLPAEFYVCVREGRWILQKMVGTLGNCKDYEFQEGMTIGPRGGVSTKQLRKKGKGK